eukprot:8380679-Ditylum_brightwellii.AAC.1
MADDDEKDKAATYGMVYGFGQSIKQTRDPDLPATEGTDINTSNETGQKQAKIVRLNAIVMCNLTMAFPTKSLMGLIYVAITNDWPTGLTYM